MGCLEVEDFLLVDLGVRFFFLAGGEISGSESGDVESTLRFWVEVFFLAGGAISGSESEDMESTLRFWDGLGAVVRAISIVRLALEIGR